MKLKLFFKSLQQSVIDPAYYRDILDSRLRFSIKYYALLSFLLILSYTVAAEIKYAASVQKNFTLTSQEVIRDFPKDLVLDIKPGNITANKDFPLIAKNPTVFRSSPNSPKNFAVVDPKGEIDLLKKYDAQILINNNNMIVNTGGNFQTTPIKDWSGMRVDYPTMQELSNVLLAISRNAVAIIAAAFITAGLLNYFILKVIYLVIFSFGIWVTYRSVLKRYTQSLKVSIHSFTLPILINAVVGILGVRIPIPMWFLLVHAIFTFYILSGLEKSTQN